MRLSSTPLRLLVAAAWVLAAGSPAPAQKKGANEAVLRQLDAARAEVTEGLQLLQQGVGVASEARKRLRGAVERTHRAGKLLVDAGPTDAQRRAIGMVLQGTLRLEQALELIDEALETDKINTAARLAEEKAAFKLARAERKRAMAEAAAERKATQAAEKAAAAVADEGTGTASEEEAVTGPSSGAGDGGDGPAADDAEEKGEDEDGEDGEDGEEEAEEKKEEAFVDLEVVGILERATQAARAGQELLERGVEVFPRRS